ncbi:hypothetical protein [Flammeovirga aprica]|uniref:Uncharacterized protein n=1 Tax=Flammeovirga aprica JL-4 TaxID=694437 RepID=A0A7X9RW21_9BACT|nr:hypothetical protein [Flammeovirga aprica]NME69772.1 hypothetical protein [Flammeovirga aprica JL-4]
MIELIDELQKSSRLDIEKVSKSFDKIQLVEYNEIKGGMMAQLIWKDKKADKGYIFEYPNGDIDEFECFVHIPFPSENPKKPIFKHLYNITTNSNLKIIVIGG